MPEKHWIFDTVALSNFLLSDATFILENRYRKRGLVTRQITLGILKASVLDGHLKLDQADKILSKMTDAGFYSPLRSIVDII